MYKKSHAVILSLLILSTSFLFSGCRTTGNAKGIVGGTDNLTDLQRLSWSSSHRTRKEAVSSIRMQILKETALSVGARSGLAFRSKEINAMLDQEAKTLDRIFNFSGLVMEHRVLPPILEQATSPLNVASFDALRLSDKVYAILEQARFVSAPPTWRDYLYMDFQQPEIPDRTLLPRDKHEKPVWQACVTQGFEDGVAQAEAIYADNLARLRRDYEGMVLYKKLLAQHMVSKPFVAKINLGVTGDGSEIRINDQILRITALPALDPNSRNWKPIIAEKTALPPILTREMYRTTRPKLSANIGMIK